MILRNGKASWSRCPIVAGTDNMMSKNAELNSNQKGEAEFGQANKKEGASVWGLIGGWRISSPPNFDL